MDIGVGLPQRATEDLNAAAVWNYAVRCNVRRRTCPLELCNGDVVISIENH